MPGPGNLIATRTDTSFVDVGSEGAYYKLSAVDVHGNESAFTLLGPGQTTGVDACALAFALEPPVSPTHSGRVSVRFTLGTAEPGQLTLLDVVGRRVASLEVMGAGRHEVAVGEGRHLGPGMYFVQLTQGNHTVRARVVVIE